MSVECVYFVEEADRKCVKIGVTKDPVHRLRLLQVANPYLLRIAAIAQGSAMAERSLHRRFAGQRMQGEWFAPSEELSRLMASYPSWEEVQAGAVIPSCDHGNEVLIAMYNDGFTLEAIRKVIGLTKQAVDLRARNLNLPRRRIAKIRVNGG